jgi:hypothetical protein
MKTKFLMTLLVCLAVAFRVNAQTLCASPPDCIQNGALTTAAPTATGNMNSTAALTIQNWYVSHGTPSASSGEVFMWSYKGFGEGIFTCYNFVAGRKYRVCLNAKFAGTNNTGHLLIDATTGLTPGDLVSNVVPVPTTNTNIATANITNTAMLNYSYDFTANANYNQLWIRPFLQSDIPQYAVSVDNIHVEDLSIPDPPISINASGPFLNGVPVTLTAFGAPPGTTYVWSPSGVTGNTISITPNCNLQEVTVTAYYYNCKGSNIKACRRAVEATINVIATNCGCCNAWGSISYLNYSNPTSPASVSTTCGSQIPLVCGTVMGFNFNYTCKEGCSPTFKAKIVNSSGNITYSNTASGSSAFNISNYYLSTPGMYTLSVSVYCGNQLCGTCTLILNVAVGNCIPVGGKSAETPKNLEAEVNTETASKEPPTLCCNPWGNVFYEDYTNPSAPVTLPANCGQNIYMNCGLPNSFHYNYTCKEGCGMPSFTAELYNAANVKIYAITNIVPSNWFHLSNLPLTSGNYKLVMKVSCGNQKCSPCTLFLTVTDFNCDQLAAKASKPVKPHTIIPNPASNVATIVSSTEPILNYRVQSSEGITLLKDSNINKKEVSLDIRYLTKGIYTVIINDSYSYKLIKE